MRPSPRWRLVLPAVLAALVPLAAAVVVGGMTPAGVPGTVRLAVHAVWAAAPFVAVAALVAAKPGLRPAFGLAAAVGLGLTAAGWGWLAAAVTRGSGWAALGAATVPLALPVAAASVMITVVAVRTSFAGGPGPR